MIVPQPTQRYTGYSSEGTRNLLDAVMSKRKADADERRDRRDFAFRKEQYDTQQKQLEETKAANKAIADMIDSQKAQQERVANYYKEREKFRKNKGSIGSVNLLDLAINPFFLHGLRKYGIIDYPDDGSITLGRYLHGLYDPTIYDRQFEDITGGLPKVLDIPFNPNASPEIERRRQAANALNNREVIINADGTISYR